MTRPTLPMAGSCRCGQVRIEISAPPLFTSACHCRGCQKMSASAYSLSVAIPTSGFRVTEGEPVLGGLQGEPIRHHFCPHCKSWMFTRIEGMDLFVNVRATMLDDTSWYTPFIETWTDERLPWATTPARHSYPGFPPEADFPRLLAEFAGA
jgi:hypothetical protein